MTALQRADRSGWRRRAGSADRWQLVVTLAHCTQGDIWDTLLKETYLRVPADMDMNREWDFQVTLAGETPKPAPARLLPQQGRAHGGYRTKEMRPR